MFIGGDSGISLTVGQAFFDPQATSCLELVRERHGGEARIPKRGEVPGRVGGSAMPLFAGGAVSTCAESHLVTVVCRSWPCSGRVG